MAKKKKSPKKPAPPKEDLTLKVNATFEQLLKVAATASVKKNKDT